MECYISDLFFTSYPTNEQVVSLGVMYTYACVCLYVYQNI